ncbi:sensor histidine kinase [Elizabethkingia miricola]|uniref:sensor histidine kinase n=1 Tax=Elizabethkingia miricola TaxID=172045 RepID=UPI0038918343
MNMEDVQDIQVNGFIKFLVEDRYRIIRHVIFIIGLFLLFYSSNPKVTSDSSQIYKFYMVLLGWSVFITMFYVNMYILVPYFFFRSKYLLYLLLLIILVAVSLSFISYIINNNTTFKFREDKSLYSGIIISTPIILTTTTLKLFQRWIKDKERISELKNLSLSMELDVLKNQINPHFLFNMLNNVKALIRKNPEQATEVLMKLSSFLRHQLYENNDKTTPLTDEINSLSNFLNLEELRRENFTAVINHNQDIQSFNSIFIPPNLFTTFVENAVKHSVDLADNSTYIIIDFTVENSRLIFTCRNSVSPDLSLEEDRYSGLGLKNIKRRLELLYQNQYSLDIISTETEYIVNLTIPLSL